MHGDSLNSYNSTGVESDLIMRELQLIINELKLSEESSRLRRTNNDQSCSSSPPNACLIPYSYSENFGANNNNKTCFVCNGYYGPCFEDPTCATCHAFLYPNVAPDMQVLTILQDHSDDSDSGNDEPADNMYRSNGNSLYFFEEDNIKAVPVRIEGLAQQLDRLSVPQHHVEVNIENLPPEVLMHTFKYLDEISLWSVGQVSTRWRQILNMHINPLHWRSFTLHRWPLLHTREENQDWYEFYTAMMESSWCIKCIRQMAAKETPAGEENSWRNNRLRSEVRNMRMDPLDGIQAKPLDSLCCHWLASIQGPAGSPYEGGLFFLYIQIPYSYPMCPPVVRFLTRIFHPNVSRHGDIGIDSIHHNWSLALTINKVLISIQSLLTDAFCDVCMQPEVGELYLRDRAAFEEQARKWTWRYAMHDLIIH